MRWSIGAVKKSSVLDETPQIINFDSSTTLGILTSLMKHLAIIEERFIFSSEPIKAILLAIQCTFHNPNMARIGFQNCDDLFFNDLCSADSTT